MLRRLVGCGILVRSSLVWPKWELPKSIFYRPFTSMEENDVSKEWIDISYHFECLDVVLLELGTSLL